VAIEGANAIHLGDEVTVGAGTCLAASPLTGFSSCRLEIGSGCSIGRYNHIYATRKIIFGQKVLTANGVYVSDNLHGYEDTSLAVLDQKVVQLNDVEIGDGSWIGHNACVIGASIGRNCVIGANAVVTRDIPDFSVAVGAPAVVIRRFVSQSAEWERLVPPGTKDGKS
jgi:acetyltransferase-like isoleucine patch superfamily enzyme